MSLLADYLIQLATAPPTPVLSPTQPTGGSGSSPSGWVPAATFAAAIVAALAALISAYLQRKSAREAAGAARTSATAAQTSAKASSRSAKAAEDSVALNADTASAAGRRSDAESLSRRYQDASAQLGHDKAAVRLAGAYAMSRLADDWHEQRQTCVDVLCAYLRMPWPGDAHDGDYEVRASISRLISDHVRREIGPTDPPLQGAWSNLKFNFDGAILRDFTLEWPIFMEEVSFRRTRFEGQSRIAGPTFVAGANFRKCVIADSLLISQMTLADFLWAQELRVEQNAELTLAHASILGRKAEIVIEHAVIEGRIDLILGVNERDLTLSFADAEVGPAGFVVINFLNALAGVEAGLLLSRWVVQENATVWLPERGSAMNAGWDEASVDPSAAIHFGSEGNQV